MIKLDGMLMIGSASANVGKTELACALIKRFSRDHEIVGIKVTTIRERDGRCPRGGVGCGVCSSLDGHFDITQETDIASGKDTARLLAAGAGRVYWLRAVRTHLKEGLTALLNVIGPDAVSICESNSLRQVVEPGLFLMLKGSNRQAPKSSAQAVMECADRIVVSDGKSFDFDISRIKSINGKWLLAERATAIILAGGGSGRMGTDKALLPIKGRPMIETVYQQLRGSFDQILISASGPENFVFLGADVVPDKIAGQGPLMGIASALEVSRSELNFVVACDIPLIDVRFVRRMLAEAQKSRAQIVIPKSADEKYEPLFAVYHKNVIEVMQKVLSAGGRKISDVFSQCSVRYIKLEAKRFMNINTEAQYQQFRAEYDD